MTDDPIFSKNALILSSHITLSKSKRFVNLKETQLFHLVIKQMKPFAVPKDFMRWKTKRGIGVVFFWTDNFVQRQVDFEKLRAAIELKEFWHFPDEWFKMF